MDTEDGEALQQTLRDLAQVWLQPIQDWPDNSELPATPVGALG